MPASDPDESPAPLARTLAFLVYGLLFLGPVTVGAAGLLGLVLAYALRDGAPPLVRSHHRFQIRLFWIEIALLAAAAALFVSALFDVARPQPEPFHIPLSPHAQTIAYRPGEAGEARLEPAQFDTFTYSYHFGTWTWTGRALIEAWTAAALAGVGAVWGFAAPIWGALRLASGRPMGHSPR